VTPRARDTIFALSSGQPPAGIAVVRISGPEARSTLTALCGTLPPPRQASLRGLRGADGELLDRALVLWLPGPRTATGEDLGELHLHGGRAIVAAVLAALATRPDLRMARAGEMTRRAFENGQIDLLQAEGLADLLAAETEAQRRLALRVSDGGLSRHVEEWRQAVLVLSAQLEAALDYADEDDVDLESTAAIRDGARVLAERIAAVLRSPPAERLRDGLRIVLAGRPNVGKSSLLNCLVGREVSIVTDIAGTTRDVIEAPAVLAGLPMIFTDTAGLRNDVGDEVEAIGIERASRRIADADIVLWLDEPALAPARDHIIIVTPKADVATAAREGWRVSARTGEGVEALRTEIVARARSLLPDPEGIAFNGRQRDLAQKAVSHLSAASREIDVLLVAEELRLCRVVFDSLVGRAGVEDMLDALFGRFCVGK
jgi:tRNA modification GTPase